MQRRRRTLRNSDRRGRPRVPVLVPTRNARGLVLHPGMCLAMLRAPHVRCRLVETRPGLSLVDLESPERSGQFWGRLVAYTEGLRREFGLVDAFLLRGAPRKVVWPPRPPFTLFQADSIERVRTGADMDGVALVAASRPLRALLRKLFPPPSRAERRRSEEWALRETEEFLGEFRRRYDLD